MIKKGFIVSLLIFGITIITIVSIINELRPLQKSQSRYTTDININTLVDSKDGGSASEIIGQVTITNIDADNGDIRLNGSIIEITNKETGNKLTLAIESDGILVHELPLGSYTIKQLKSKDEYTLDSNVYEFNLSVPENAEQGKVKVINANVVLKNGKLNATAPNTETIVKPESKQITFDKNNILILVAVILFAALVSIILFVINLKQKLNRLKNI